MNFGYNGLLGLLVLAGDIWAIINIVQSSASNEKETHLDNCGGAAPAVGIDPVVFSGAAQRTF
jgi:hypothetical protein